MMVSGIHPEDLSPKIFCENYRRPSRISWWSSLAYLLSVSESIVVEEQRFESWGVCVYVYVFIPHTWIVRSSDESWKPPEWWAMSFIRRSSSMIVVSKTDSGSPDWDSQKARSLITRVFVYQLDDENTKYEPQARATRETRAFTNPSPPPGHFFFYHGLAAQRQDPQPHCFLPHPFHHPTHHEAQVTKQCIRVNPHKILQESPAFWTPWCITCQE